MEQINAFFDALGNSSFINILFALLTFVIGWIAIRYLTRLVSRILNRNEKLDISLQKFLVNVIRIVAFVVLILMCADQLGLPMTSFITLLGTAGLAASLALQDSLANLAGGIFILVSKPFATGDFIEMGSVSGTVSEIGFIHTVLNTVDNRRIYVPNGGLSADRIINYSAEPRRQLELKFPVPYSCDTAMAKQVITETVLADSRALHEPTPFIRVWELNSSSVDILVRVWVNSPDYFELKCALLENVKMALDKAGIAIPFNQLDVNLVSVPEKKA